MLPLLVRCGAEAHHARLFVFQEACCSAFGFNLSENTTYQSLRPRGGCLHGSHASVTPASVPCRRQAPAVPRENRHATARPAARRCPPMNASRRVIGLAVGWRWPTSLARGRASVVATRWRRDRRTRLDLMGTRRARRRTTGRGAASDGSVVGRVAVHPAAGCRLPANCEVWQWTF